MVCSSFQHKTNTRHTRSLIFGERCNKSPNYTKHLPRINRTNTAVYCEMFLELIPKFAVIATSEEARGTR